MPGQPHLPHEVDGDVRQVDAENEENEDIYLTHQGRGREKTGIEPEGLIRRSQG